MVVRSRRPAAALIATLFTTLILSGCEHVGTAIDSTKDFVDKSTEKTKAWFRGDVPPDDGTACYLNYRVPFYKEANNAANAKSVLTGVGNIVTPLVQAQLSSTYSSTVGNRLTQDFIGTMQGVLMDVQNDTTRIQRLTTRFNALILCRRQEAVDINTQYLAGNLSRTDAETRMAKLRTLIAEDAAKARQTNAQISARSEAFQVAAKQARKEAAAAPTETKRQEHKKEVENVEDADKSEGTERISGDG